MIGDHSALDDELYQALRFLLLETRAWQYATTRRTLPDE
jgi:hypothetical protein